jgi:MFS family permease
VTTTTSSAPPAPIEPSDRKTRVRVAWASLVGTSLESYDFYIYSYLSAFFIGPLFFTPLGEFGAGLAAFLSIGIAFVVRPIGAVIFGHIGDRIGRRKTLILTITIMGVATGAIGLLPTYEVGGWWGAILLVTLRMVQGLSLAGEWGGAVLLASEHAGQKRHAFYAAIPQLGSPIGSALSAIAYFILPFTLSAEDFAAWGWRVPFLLAFPLLLVSLWLRWTVKESPVFNEVVSEHKVEKFPLGAVFRNRPTAFLLAIGAALLGIGSYSIMNTYTLSYGAGVLGFDYNELLGAVTIGSILQLVTIPLFGAWANRIGSARVVAIGALGTLLVAFPMYFVLQEATFAVLVGMMIIGGILPTAAWAALGGLMAELFDARFRYSGISFAYSISAAISGFIPALLLWLGVVTDQAWWHPAALLALISLITLVSAVLARPRVEPIYAV